MTKSINVLNKKRFTTIAARSKRKLLEKVKQNKENQPEQIYCESRWHQKILKNQCEDENKGFQADWEELIYLPY